MTRVSLVWSCAALVLLIPVRPAAGEEVRIYRDGWGVIYADTAVEAAYGLGYAQGEDRLEAVRISRDLQEETPEAKARWFRALSLEERMEMLCAFTDLILSNNPGIVEQKQAQSTTGRIRARRKPYKKQTPGS